MDPECGPRLSHGGRIPEVSVSDHAQDRSNNPSTTSNLLFGNFQHPLPGS